MSCSVTYAVQMFLLLLPSTDFQPDPLVRDFTTVTAFAPRILALSAGRTFAYEKSKNRTAPPAPPRESLSARSFSTFSRS